MNLPVIDRFHALDLGNSKVSGALQLVLLVLVVLGASVLTGIVAAFGSVKVAVLLAALIGGLALLALPAPLLVSVVVLLAFVVVGQLFYFAGMGQSVWIVFGLGLLLFAKWLMSLFERGHAFRVDSMNAMAWIFLSTVLFSVLINLPPPLQAVAGGKNLVALWGLFFVVGAGMLSSRHICGIFKAFYWLLLFQVPLVLYQYFVVAPSRTRFGATAGGVEWDAVVGGFGGDPEGGGYSGGMAYFVCVAIAFAIAAYRRGLFGRFRLATALAAGALCVGLAEVKVVVVLLPVAALVMFAPLLRRRPLIALLGIPASLVMAFAVLVAYESLHYGNAGGSSVSPTEIVERAFGYSLDPNHINYRSGEMGRVAAVVHWWHEHGWHEPTKTLFGHGPGASRGNSIVGPGEAARNYPFLIDRSAATQLLWDVGVFGLFSYLLLCLLAVLNAMRLMYRLSRDNAEEAAMLEGCAAGLAMLVVMLFYGREPLEAPAVTVSVMLMLGYVAWLNRQLSESRQVASYAGSFTQHE